MTIKHHELLPPHELGEGNSKVKQPCVFCSPCLRSWLAQDISCPTCRVSLSEQKTENPATHSANTGDDAATLRGGEGAGGMETRRHRTNHLFHFDGKICRVRHRVLVKN